MSESKTKSKAKVEPVQHVLMKGKHSRRQEDGTSIILYPGQIVPDLSDAELSAFGDKFLTVEQFRAKAVGFDQAQDNETRREQAALQAKSESQSKTWDTIQCT